MLFEFAEAVENVGGVRDLVDGAPLGAVHGLAVAGGDVPGPPNDRPQVLEVHEFDCRCDYLVAVLVEEARVGVAQFLDRGAVVGPERHHGQDIVEVSVDRVVDPRNVFGDVQHVAAICTGRQ